MGEATDDEEFVRVITSFYDDSGVEYLITEPLEPVLIVAKPTNPDAKPKAKVGILNPGPQTLVEPRRENHIPSPKDSKS
jgi:hypothetical protein